MSRRRSTGSIFINNLDPGLKERILNLKISREVLTKFDEEEKKDDITYLTDLMDIRNKSEIEVYNTLNLLFKNQQ
jgi:hypothetical protein